MSIPFTIKDSKPTDSIDHEIYDLNMKYFAETLSDRTTLNWSGCNYYINQGKTEIEPIGTATSMHDCGGCKYIRTCILKKQTPIWRWNEEMEIQRIMIAKVMKLR